VSLLESIAAAPIGVFAYVRKDGTPNAIPVTPFVTGGKIVVTSTLAYVAKAAAVRRDPRVALLAGDVRISTTARVLVDQTPSWFNTHIRDDEIKKFPPTKQLLQLPFNECLPSTPRGPSSNSNRRSSRLLRVVTGFPWQASTHRAGPASLPWSRTSTSTQTCFASMMCPTAPW